MFFSRKEQWGQSVCQVWSVLLTQTRLESREHAALGDTCCNTLTQRLVHSTEDTHRLHKRVSRRGLLLFAEADTLDTYKAETCTHPHRNSSSSSHHTCPPLPNVQIIHLKAQPFCSVTVSQGLTKLITTLLYCMYLWYSCTALSQISQQNPVSKRLSLPATMALKIQYIYRNNLVQH